MKFLAFDLDGTLCNTLPDITASLNRVLAAEGLASHDEAEGSRMVGRSIAWLLQNALPQADAEMRERLGAAYYADYSRNFAVDTYIYPGLLTVLEQLKAKGHKLAVVTNKPHAHAVRLIEKFFPRHGELFCQVLGQGSRFPTKPAPDMLRYVLNMQGVAADNAVYVGDSDVDLAFARNAGVPCLACGWGFIGESGLTALGAEHIMREPSDLLRFLGE